MNRRDFLKAAGSAAAAAAIPAAVATTTSGALTLDALRRLVDNMRLAATPAPETYWAFLHPAALLEWKHQQARESWGIAWRGYRIARRENVCGHLPPRAVLERFGPDSIEGRLMDPAQVATGEIGRYEGIRFITS